MIFVTVGTHEQPFNRLIECMDELKRIGTIQEEVILQTGFSTYIPQHCRWSKLYTYQEMVKYVADAHIVITHGGPSSFIMPLLVGKIPIVVPRQKNFHEHVNNHQVEFSKAVAKRQGNIIVVEDMKDLISSILNYDSIVKAMPTAIASNNLLFNKKFEAIVNDLVKERTLENG